MGDFNDIASPREKFGGNLPNRTKMAIFNNFLNKSNLVDLGFSGPLFTWTNNREFGRTIRTRIDRCHANPSWISLFPNSKVFHLPRIHSDHCPILLKTIPSNAPKEKIFRLESFWMNHHEFPNFVQNNWNNHLPDIDTNILNIKKISKIGVLKTLVTFFMRKIVFLLVY